MPARFVSTAFTTGALFLSAALSSLATTQLLALPVQPQTAVRLVALRTEYKENPLGIDTRNPRLSWQLQSARRGTAQSAYEIRVSESEAGIRGGRSIWDSGRVTSDESTQRPYA